MHRKPFRVVPSEWGTLLPFVRVRKHSADEDMVVLSNLQVAVSPVHNEIGRPVLLDLTREQVRELRDALAAFLDKP